VLSAGLSHSLHPPLPQTGKRTMTFIVSPQQLSGLSSQRAPVMPRSPRACRSPAYAFVVRESPASASNFPRLNRDDDHPSANTMRSGRQSERLRSSHQLKIP
jgi:hypothetical protein